MTPLQDAARATGKACHSGKVSECLPSIDVVLANIDNTQRHLAQAPACLQNVDFKIRSALVGLKTGMLKIHNSNGDALSINAGTRSIDEAKQTIDEAADLLEVDKANCSLGGHRARPSGSGVETTAMNVDDFRRELVNLPMCGKPATGPLAGKAMCTVHGSDGAATLAGAGLVARGFWSTDGRSICRRDVSEAESQRRCVTYERLSNGHYRNSDGVEFCLGPCAEWSRG
jgi:hypothetical protein